MKRTLKIFIGIVLAAVIGVFCVVLFWAGPALKKTIESLGPEITGAPVEVGSLYIYPLTGSITANHLRLGNPEGFSSPDAIVIDHLKIRIDMKTVMSDTIVIKEVVLEGPDFTYERKLTTDNISAIRKNIRSHFKQGQSEQPTPKPAAPKAASNRKVVIEHLILRDGWVNAELSQIGGISVRLPDMERNDIGKKGSGMGLDTAFDQILAILDDAIVEVITSAGKASGSILKDAGDAAKDLGDTASDALKGLGNLLKK